MLDTDFMRQALMLAAEDASEVPVGAVIVRSGKVISGAHNEQVSTNDALAHAELLAISRARKVLGVSRLEGCTIYVTMEPCPMCAGALVMSGMKRCVFAAFDTQYGCCGTGSAAAARSRAAQPSARRRRRRGGARRGRRAVPRRSPPSVRRSRDRCVTGRRPRARATRAGRAARRPRPRRTG